MRPFLVLVVGGRGRSWPGSRLNQGGLSRNRCALVDGATSQSE